MSLSFHDFPVGGNYGDFVKILSFGPVCLHRGPRMTGRPPPIKPIQVYSTADPWFSHNFY